MQIYSVGLHAFNSAVRVCCDGLTSSSSSEVGLSYGVLQCKRFGHYVTFRVEEQQEELEVDIATPKANAFNVLIWTGRDAHPLSRICTSTKDRRGQIYGAMLGRLAAAQRPDRPSEGARTWFSQLYGEHSWKAVRAGRQPCASRRSTRRASSAVC